MNRFDKLDVLLKALGKDETLYALTRAMSEDEFQEKYDYIMRGWGLYEKEEEEEEE